MYEDVLLHILRASERVVQIYSSLTFPPEAPKHTPILCPTESSQSVSQLVDQKTTAAATQELSN